MSHFNTLQSFDRLKRSGVSEKQARVIIETIEESSGLKTEDLELKIEKLRTELELAKKDLEFKILEVELRLSKSISLAKWQVVGVVLITFAIPLLLKHFGI